MLTKPELRDLEDIVEFYCEKMTDAKKAFFITSDMLESYDKEIQKSASLIKRLKEEYVTASTLERDES